MPPILFFSEEIDFTLSDEAKTQQWITDVITQEGYELDAVNYIFCSDNYLHQINTDYLNHDTFTDIITFDQSEEEGKIAGDIFISVDRVRDNSQAFDQSATDELDRVMIHGILHLMGHGDGTEEEKKAMRKKEEACLSLR